MKCDMSHLSADLKKFCNEGHDMEKFAADTKSLAQKLEFYGKMEAYAGLKVKQAEDKVKQKANDIAARLVVDEIEEKIYP